MAMGLLLACGGNGEGNVLRINPETMGALDATRWTVDFDTDLVFGLLEQQISRRIATACESTGLGKGYSGHSRRVGAALALGGANISLAAIMENRRWQCSRMPARYTRSVAVPRSAMAKLYGHNDHDAANRLRAQERASKLRLDSLTEEGRQGP